jgi:two-component system sensor histidine kinase MprB
MSLRSRLALLIAATVLLASALGGVGVALSSRSVGLKGVEAQLNDDIERFDPDSPRIEGQLAALLEIRRLTCAEDASDELAEEPAAANAGETDEADAAGEPARTPGTRLTRPERFAAFVSDFASSMQVIRSNGVTISGCRTLPIDGTDTTIAETGVGTSIRTVTVDDERYRVLTAGFGDIGAVQVARSVELTESTLRGLFVRIVGFGIIGALSAGLLGWFFTRRATQPIERLSAAANRVASTQDLGERIPVDGTGEISALASSFNTMLESLDTSREQQRRLVQDASHELRTPLTSMRTNVELLQRHPDVDPELRGRVLNDIGDELAELSELTAELVDSATEIRDDLDQRTVVDFGDIVAECVTRAQRRHQRTIELETITAESTVLADAGLLARAVTNLINNAAKFSPDETPILIAHAGTSIRVLDEGPGVRDEDLERIFDRFYRSDEARTAPGSGLGLAIVKQIVDGHDGTLHATNRATGGFEIGFSLPAVGPLTVGTASTT